MSCVWVEVESVLGAQAGKAVADSLASELRCVTGRFYAAGLTRRPMVAELTRLGIKPPNGGTKCSLFEVQRLQAVFLILVLDEWR